MMRTIPIFAKSQYPGEALTEVSEQINNTIQYGRNLVHTNLLVQNIVDGAIIWEQVYCLLTIDEPEDSRSVATNSAAATLF